MEDAEGDGRDERSKRGRGRGSKRGRGREGRDCEEGEEGQIREKGDVIREGGGEGKADG